MTRRDIGAALWILCLTLVWAAQETRPSPPGKPKLTSCRSPEKETFTCWWEGGSDGGLPTTYALFYRKESSETVYECPDYRTAGENSCFFNKNDTSIWVNYNITVVASNALGSNFSDPVDVDVVYIVKPHMPENVTVSVIEDKDGPFLRVSWEPPRKADTRSGWITLIYELRVKLEGEEDWEKHHAGQQKMFNMFSLRSGGTYLVQVRCKPDHGFWSEWSSTTHIKVPDFIPREKSMWILLATFAAFLFVIFTWILNLKSHRVKRCLLPPVPGPKIKGFDKHLLKKGRSDEVFNALVMPGFPPTFESSYEDLMVEYLEVYTPEEQELMLEGGKDLKEGCLKPKSSPSDSDSGRGSCDSHTLLMEKCGQEAKEEEEEKEVLGDNGTSSGDRKPDQSDREVGSPDSSDGRVKTWPSVFSPLSLYSSRPSEQGSLERAKQLCLSDSLFPSSASCSFAPRVVEHSNSSAGELGLGGLGECYLEKKQAQHHAQFQPHWHLQAHKEFNIPGKEHKRAAPVLQPNPSRSMEYVEVQRINQENMVVLQPLSFASAQVPEQIQGENYSKVKAIADENVLLLQGEVTGEEAERYGCPCDDRERGEGLTESCYTANSTAFPQMQGKTVTYVPCATITMQGATSLAPGGYVETVTMMPTC